MYGVKKIQYRVTLGSVHSLEVRRGEAELDTMKYRKNLEGVPEKIDLLMDSHPHPLFFLLEPASRRIATGFTRILRYFRCFFAIIKDFLYDETVC